MNLLHDVFKLAADLVGLYFCKRFSYIVILIVETYIRYFDVICTCYSILKRASGSSTCNFNIKPNSSYRLPG